MVLTCTGSAARCVDVAFLSTNVHLTYNRQAGDGVGNYAAYTLYVFHEDTASFIARNEWKGRK